MYPACCLPDIGLKKDHEAGLHIAAQAAEQRPELKVLYTSGQAIIDGMRALLIAKSAVPLTSSP
jgi:hypothetical protein